jgi:hypothetical protein
MGACHPDDLPEGYRTAARGQSMVDAGGGRAAAQAVRLALEHCARRDLNGYQPAAHVTRKGRTGTNAHASRLPRRHKKTHLRRRVALGAEVPTCKLNGRSGHICMS